MGYEVTATRRRPQQFKDLAGQEFTAATLENTIKSRSIANAYLFSGPRGCGKTSSARIFAKALNCMATDGPNPTPCGKCESCIAIAASSSLDVIEIDGASNTSVNDVRAIKDEVMFPPNSARYKIYIIDEVHMLSTSAFNALLKTIEEPPPFVVFIFATTELQKVPATIKSRCQEFNFRLVSTEKIKSLLADAAKELGIQADDEALYWIAKESGGSVRDSYTLFDQVAAFSDGAITYEKIRDKLGLIGVEAMNALFLHCANGEADKALLAINDFIERGSSIETIASTAAEYLRSLLLLKVGVTKESLLCASATRFDTTILQLWTRAHLERALSLFLQLFRNIRSSVNARYELELTVSILSDLSDYITPSDVKRAIEKMRVALTSGEPAQIGGSEASSAVSIEAKASFQNGSSGQSEGDNLGNASLLNQNKAKSDFDKVGDFRSGTAFGDNDKKMGEAGESPSMSGSVADALNAARAKNGANNSASGQVGVQEKDFVSAENTKSEYNEQSGGNFQNSEERTIENADKGARSEEGSALASSGNSGAGAATFGANMAQEYNENANNNFAQTGEENFQEGSGGFRPSFSAEDSKGSAKESAEETGGQDSDFSQTKASGAQDDEDGYDDEGVSDEVDEGEESLGSNSYSAGASLKSAGNWTSEQKNAPIPQFVEDIKNRVSGAIVK